MISQSATTIPSLSDSFAISNKSMSATTHCFENHPFGEDLGPSAMGCIDDLQLKKNNSFLAVRLRQPFKKENLFNLAPRIIY